jgi:peptidoglycan hydrolase-like protein with peptidoglycan-binding domain
MHSHVFDLAGVCTGPGPCDVTPTGSGKNWVTKVGGLPLYIRAIAHALRRSGHSESDAIQKAVGIVKNWASGQGKVTPATRARAAAAVAEWERKKAQAHLSASSSGAVDMASCPNCRTRLVVDMAPGEPPNQTKTTPAQRQQIRAQKTGTLKQNAQASGGDFNSKHPRAGAGSPTGGQFITAGSGGAGASQDEKDQVAAVQKELGVPVTGTFSPSDSAALVKWQKKQGLQADGVVGAQTVSRMSDGPDVGPGALTAENKAFLKKRKSANYAAPSAGSVDLAARTDLLRRAVVAHKAGRLSPKHRRMLKTYLTRVRKAKG